MENNVKKPNSLKKRAWLKFKEHKFAFIGIFVVGFYVLISVLQPILPIYNYHTQIVEHANLPPSFKTAGELWYKKELESIKKISEKENREINEKEKEKLEKIKLLTESETQVIDRKKVKIHKRIYLLGTDNLGRDLLARIIQGGQVSLSVGLIGAFLSLIIGTTVGAIAGFLGGFVDKAILKIIETLYILPFVLIVIILMTIMEKRNLIGLFIALSLVSWLTVALITRGQVKSLSGVEFVQVAKTLGATNLRIIFKHLIPNTLGIIVVFTTLRVPSFILAEAALSFLGLGISAPMTSWGDLIKSGVPTLTQYPWKVFIPSIIMTIFMLFINFIGDGLRDVFDPRSNI